ncbi:MAG: squalene/phytoene synthase family protein [Defluviimonas sp.]|nr:squalene/phytoene synthase family protein [Defluviimonas sp.]
MSLEACAASVEAGDPDRFAATMATPAAARAALWPLYAANLEIARAPWAAREPLVAEMRLQWWIDTLEELAAGQDRPGHAVTEALAPALRADPGLAPLLTGLAEARRHDCRAEPFPNARAFDAYLDATSGNLMWAAARALGAPERCEATVRDFAWGAGLARYLEAAPELVARGRRPFVDPDPAALAALAGAGRDRIARARAARASIPPSARPALWPGASAAAILARAAARPERIAAARLALSPFRRRASLLGRALAGTF